MIYTMFPFQEPSAISVCLKSEDEGWELTVSSVSGYHLSWGVGVGGAGAEEKSV